MPAEHEIVVENLATVQRAFAKADRESRLALRADLREVAEPVRSLAEGYAVDRIRNIGPKWSRMRTGVTRKLVYVAPRQRGIRNPSDPRKRPNLAKLLMFRAMEPALEKEGPHIEERFERTLDKIADRFNAGGRV